MKLINMFKHFEYGDIVPLSKGMNNYRTFSTREEADDWGAKVYTNWSKCFMEMQKTSKSIYPNIPRWSCNSLGCYCGESYREMNSYLRTNISNSNWIPEAVNTLVMTIASAPPIPEDVVAYRAVSDKFIQKLISNNKQGHPTNEPGFLSTTLVHDVLSGGEWYTSHTSILKLYIPKGTPGIYVAPITRRTECELLIAPNRYIYLTAYPYQDNESGKTVYECELRNSL